MLAVQLSGWGQVALQLGGAALFRIGIWMIMWARAQEDRDHG